MLYAGEWLNLWQEVQALAPEAILPHWAQTTPGLVAEAHQNGLAIYPWVVNHEEWMERFTKWGGTGSSPTTQTNCCVCCNDHKNIIL